ncbi:MAG: hypothetical protein II629_03995 [Ruminococcus sp.]|nr:hypothetical protein [Ruminococcus sp.]MBQ5631396.1 hypothetical protein [Ruminococcus sp.]
MKRYYTEPEFELVELRMEAIMSGLTLHSVTESGGTGGALGDDDDGDDIDFP